MQYLYMNIGLSVYDNIYISIRKDKHMNTIKVKVSFNYSAAFPVFAEWKTGTARKTNAFETEEQMKAYFIGRYWSVKFIRKENA